MRFFFFYLYIFFLSFPQIHDLTSGLPLVTPKISFKPSIRVAPVAYVAPAAKSCFTAYRLLIREKVNARNLTL